MQGAASEQRSRQRPTHEGFLKIIRSLNEDYDLGLSGPDVTLSPSKRRSLRQSEREKQSHDLYQRLHVLHFRGSLSQCLGQFRHRADAISRDWIDKPRGDPDTLPTISAPLGVRSAEGRAALRQCLQDILQVGTDRAAKLAKRVSPESSDASLRRTKPKLGGQVDGHGKAVDRIPFRTSQPSASHQDVGAAVSQSRRFSHITDVSTNSSRASFHSASFSTTEYQGTPMSSQNTNPRSSLDLYPGTEELQALDESFSKYNDEPENVSISHDVAPAKELEPSRLVGKETVPATPKAGQQGGSLDDRLSNIWPTCPIPGLNGAPLAILWEVTRVALYCNVDLRSLDLQYDSHQTAPWWRDQNQLWSRLSGHHLFIGKNLPAKSNAQAWDVALNDFQVGNDSVVLSVDLQEGDVSPLFKVNLQPLKLRPGHRLERRFGADRFLEVTMPAPHEKGPERAHLIADWLTSRVHYFVGRVWEPFYTKTNKRTVRISKDSTHNEFPQQFYFFASDGDTFRPGNFPAADEANSPSHRTKLSCAGLLDWTVGMRRSAAQPVPKLFSRIGLSLTRTKAAIDLEEHQIIHRDKDLLSRPDNSGKTSVMNDGISRMSRSLANRIASELGLPSTGVPSAFQGRLGSAKGMWIIDFSGGVDDSGWIETVPSQRKYACDFKDPWHRKFEVKDYSRELCSADLTQQFIPILEHQAENPAKMRDVIKAHLLESVNAALGTSSPSLSHRMNYRLWLQKEGFMASERRSHDHVPFLGAMPKKHEYQAAFLLDSGFEPLRNPFLQDIIWRLREQKADEIRRKMRIRVPCSAYVYMVVDFDGVLAPDEVHMSFSTKFEAGDFSDTLLEGMDVLVARSPAHFPSDIQKVRVVSRPELRRLKDVIVFPSTGTRPLADLLSGGDYDGDKAWVCWDGEIVNNFHNAAPPPEYDFVKEGYLRKETVRFQDLLDRHRDTAYMEFRRIGLSFGMEPSLLGQCTKYKDKFCYWYSPVDSKQALLLSVLLSNLVDQSKAGIHFDKKDWDEFRKTRLNKASTGFDDPEYTKDRASDQWYARRQDCPTHILDYLKFDVAEMAIRKSLEKFSKNLRSNKELKAYDSDLWGPYRAFSKQSDSSRSAKAVLSRLKEDITVLADKWSAMTGTADFQDVVETCYQGWIDISPRQEYQKSRTIQYLKDPSSGGEEGWTAPFSGWSLIKASTAIKLFSNRRNFIWYTAGRQLAFIKAMGVLDTASHVPGRAPVLLTSDMYAALKVDKKFVEAHEAHRRGNRDESENNSAVTRDGIEEGDDDGTIIDDYE